MLKQNTNAYWWVSENYIYDSESTALTRYFMVTFTYNIRDFKGGKQVAAKQVVLFLTRNTEKKVFYPLNTSYFATSSKSLPKEPENYARIYIQAFVLYR